MLLNAKKRILAVLRKGTRASLRDAFAARNLNPDWIDAIAYVESNWNKYAVNNTGGDALRGGSYGATQMSLRTLRESGYTGTIEAYLDDATLQGKYSAEYASKGSPQSFDDLCAWWNAGRRKASDLPEGHATLTKYIPKAEDALNFIVDNPPAEAA